MNKTPAIIAVLIVVLVILGGLVYNNMVGHHAGPTYQTTPPPSRSRPTPQSGLNGPSPNNLNGRTVIYVPSQIGQGDNNDLIAQPVDLGKSETPARDALNALLHAANSPVPPGTKLRGIKIADGLATVDFSHQLQDALPGGETQQAQTLNAILKTLGQFPTIDRVQILIEGKIVDSLGEYTGLSTPQDVVRPDTVRQAQTERGAKHP